MAASLVRNGKGGVPRQFFPLTEFQAPATRKTRSESGLSSENVESRGSPAATVYVETSFPLSFRQSRYRLTRRRPAFRELRTEKDNVTHVSAPNTERAS